VISDGCFYFYEIRDLFQFFAEERSTKQLLTKQNKTQSNACHYNNRRKPVDAEKM
jgi:hypothetical protein